MIDPNQFRDAWEPHLWRGRGARWMAALIAVATLTLIAWLAV